MNCGVTVANSWLSGPLSADRGRSGARGARTSRTRCGPAVQFVVLGFRSVGGGADVRGNKISVTGGGYLSAGLRGGAVATGFGAEILERMSFSAVSRLAILRAICSRPTASRSTL